MIDAIKGKLGMGTDTRTNIPGADGWKEPWERPGAEKFSWFVNATKDRRYEPGKRGSVCIPRSMVCELADEPSPKPGVPKCNYTGYDFNESEGEAPPAFCPGKRWNGGECGMQLVTPRGQMRAIKVYNYVIRADNERIANYLRYRGYPTLDDDAGIYTETENSKRAIAYQPFQGLLWRQAIKRILAKDRQRGRKKPGEQGNAKVYGVDFGANDGPESTDWGQETTPFHG